MRNTIRQRETYNKKVYCKNCKFQMLNNERFSEYCDRRTDYTINKFTDEYIDDKVIKESFFTNINGKCNYYQKKWWKFWR